MPTFRRSLAIILATPLILVACRHRDRSDATSRASMTDAKFVARDSNRVLGPGDVQIISTDSAVELSVVGDTIIAGLGQKVLDKVRSQTGAVQGNGFGANLEKFVKKSVADALNHEVLFPISDVGDVKYQDGALQFYGDDGKKMRVFESSSNGKGNRSTFSEADAQRFIVAFEARKNHSA